MRFYAVCIVNAIRIIGEIHIGYRPDSPAQLDATGRLIPCYAVLQVVGHCAGIDTAVTIDTFVIILRAAGWCYGSSPRMWGIQMPSIGTESGMRFIPTHVGYTVIQRIEF